MPAYTACAIKTSFAFDLEAFLADFSVPDQDLRSDLARALERWQAELTAALLRAGRRQLLLVCLGNRAEKEAGEGWDKAPYRTFLRASLAQALCMGLAGQIIPQLEETGCAPVPRPTPTLASALSQLGAPYLRFDAATLSRRFSLLTPYPFQGACEICFLRQGCPGPRKRD
ncbi:MAG: hypothetical protein LBU06_12190 [Desulfovibrio sp.]|jgi:hypothetical protein|nr:hypothetical protein [Desulfovibrio sp.]